MLHLKPTEYLYVPMMDYGKERRAFIKDWFINNPDGRYCVNRKYRPQLKSDPDLKKLIKDGFLKTERVGSPRSRSTFLMRA